MAAGPVEEAGEFTTCPSCGTEVRRKAMIPVLRAVVAGGYVCRDCARAWVSRAATAVPDGDEAGDTAASAG